MESSSGHFFFRASSKYTHPEHQRFCYKKIVRIHQTLYETDYPIYVTIGKESVSFQCSMYNSQIRPNQKFTESYGAGQIQQFIFEIKDSASNWLLGSKEFESEFISSKIYCRRENKQEISYSSLGIWKLPSSESIDKLILHQRELALDFLFDLFHSSVFNSSPFVNKLKSILLKDEISRAVLAKANFYYLLEQNQSSNSVRKTNSNERNYLKEQLDKACQTWITLLRGANAELTIVKRQEPHYNWFENIEEEHKKVFSLYHHSKQIKNEASISAQWFLRRYDLFQASYLQFWVFMPPLSRLLLIVFFVGFSCRLLSFNFYQSTVINSYCPPHEKVLEYVGILSLIGFLFLGSFIAERTLTIFLGIIWKDQKNDLESSMYAFIQGIRIFLPKIILINVLTWWWLLLQGMDSAGIKKIYQFYNPFLFIVMLFIVSSVGLLSRVNEYSSLLQSPRKILIRASSIMIFSFLSSFWIGLLFSSIIIDNNSVEAIRWHFAPSPYIYCKLSVDFLIFLSMIAAALGLIFELSAQSVIEILSP